MEGTGLVAQSDEVTIVNQDAESWSILEPGICEMIWEKLLHLERLRLRGVCKEWNCNALHLLEPKPYFVSTVTIQKEMILGIFKYNLVSKNLVIERLVRIRHGITYRAVDGLIFCERPEDEKEWCVYNIHTRTKHVVPPAPGSGEYISGMMVDTSVKPYTFKLVVSYTSGGKTQIYSSASRSWSSHPKSNQYSHSSVRLPRNHESFLTLCHKGSVYMSCRYSGGCLFAYSMEEDQWTKLSGFPFVGNYRPYLGAWDDRIFAVVHGTFDVRNEYTVGYVVVWELVDGTQREWVEYARCPDALCSQLGVYGQKNDFVSVFCEEYVLMQYWYSCRSYALVMLNLKSREWESQKVKEAEHCGLFVNKDFFW